MFSGKKKKKSPKMEPVVHTVSESIPYFRVYKNGVIELEPGLFSVSFRLPDINYKTANDDVQWKISEDYANFIGSFDPEITVQLTMYNRTVDVEEFQRKVFLEMRSDGLNRYRSEKNQVLMERMAGAKNNLETEIILTITLPAADIFEANEKIAPITSTINDYMVSIVKSHADKMTLNERLDILNSIYNQDSAIPLCERRVIQGRTVESFSLENCEKQGITSKDVIAPPSMEFKTNLVHLGPIVARSYYISNYPAWIKGTILTDFASIPSNMLVSVYFNSMNQGDAVKLVKRQGVNVSSGIIEAQKKASRSGYDPNLISPDLQDSKEEISQLMESVGKDNTKLFTVNFLFTLFAEDENALKKYETQLTQIANRHMVTVKPLSLQQENALASALPIGHNKISVQRLMTTQSIASIIPFGVKEFRQEGGRCYGVNAVSRNMILYNRKSDLNPNACILGMPGGGKSFAAKDEIIDVILSTDDEVYIIDPEREYKIIADSFHGSTVKIAAGSKTFINPFDMHLKNVGDDGDPVKIKCDFLGGLCDIMVGGRYGLSPIEKSIIDRCVNIVYEPYLTYLSRTGLDYDTAHAPNMLDFYNVLSAQPQVEAQNLALSLERYVKGALDTFSHHTNISIDNRLTVYDTRDIGSGLKELGQHICLDNIWNKMIMNFEKGKRTWIYIDEFSFLMEKASCGEYVSQIWKRARKWNGFPCAITQNVEDMLKSTEARTVINNCSFIMMLGQSPINKQQLSEMFDLSPSEQKYISASKAGLGLIKVADSIIPMDNTFPSDTELYRIMTTKPDERR